MRGCLVALVVLGGGLARAEPLSPIPVQSVKVPGNANKALWKLVTGDTESWCQQKLSPSEELTITFVGKPLLTDITLSVDGGITDAEVIGNGISFSSVVSDGKIGMPFKTRAFGELVISVKGTGRGCVKRIELGIGGTIYGNNNGATLWADVAAAKNALVACDKKQLAATFAFPFTVTWPDMDQSGMKWPHTKYTSADKLAGGCKNVHIEQAVIKVDDNTKLSSTSATTVDVDDGHIRWELVLQNKHWRVKAFAFPGA